MPHPIGLFTRPQAASGGGAWTPASLSPVAWYDASDAASITASSNLVSQWNDKSGNGFHLVQGNAADQPKWGLTTLNGRNTVDYWWGAANRFMHYDSFPTVSQPLTILAVYDITDATKDLRVIDTGAAASRILLNPSAGSFGIFAGSVLNGGASSNIAVQHVAVFNGGSSVSYINGASNASGNAGSNASGAGQWDISGDGFGDLAGKLAEFVVMSGAISAGDRTSWNTYCARWGL